MSALIGDDGTGRPTEYPRSCHCGCGCGMPCWHDEDNEERYSENAGRWSIAFVAVLTLIVFGWITSRDRSHDSAHQKPEVVWTTK
jgi:hypothetical protein